MIKKIRQFITKICEVVLEIKNNFDEWEKRNQKAREEFYSFLANNLFHDLLNK